MSELAVAELWRYPVKSMRGERRAELAFDARGAVGDRAWALVDAEGKIGSHKNTRRFARMDGLFEMRGEQANGEVYVVTEDERLRAGDAALDAILSQRVGREVKLRREAKTPFQDAGAVHILTRASLRWLGASGMAGDADVRRFRPNLVLECPGEGLVEKSWVGRFVEVGSLRLRITEGTERCVMTTLAQEELEKDPGVLKAIAQGADARFGVYAEVVRPGHVHEGDAAVLLT